MSDVHPLSAAELRGSTRPGAPPSALVIAPPDPFAVPADVPVGHEYDYVQITSNVNVTATTEATANTIVTASPVVYDGLTTIIVEFFSLAVQAGTSQIAVFLYDAVGGAAAASLGYYGFHNVAGKQIPMSLKVRLTPSAASHVYSVRACVDAGTGVVAGGAGSVATNNAAFIRQTRV